MGGGAISNGYEDSTLTLRYVDIYWYKVMQGSSHKGKPSNWDYHEVGQASFLALWVDEYVMEEKTDTAV